MAITTSSGTKIYIGTTAAATDATSYAADTYTEIKEVENLGEFGDESSTVNFAAIGDARVRKLKGARDAGTLALTVGRDPLDPGQLAAKAAQGTKFEYNFKVVAADAADENDPDSIYYFRALVNSARDNYGTNDNVVRTTFNLGINTAILEVPSVATP